MTDEIKDENQGLPPDYIETDPLPAQSHDPDQDSVDLALRFLVGLLAVGADQAAQRLQDMQRKLNEDPSLWRSEPPMGNNSLRRQAWYLGVGLLKRGQRRVRRELRRGYELFLGAADRSPASSYWGSNRLPDPVKEALKTRLVQWRAEAEQMIREGELEEQHGRALATGTLAALTSEIMDEVAKNPELMAFVQEMVSQQGLGMATGVVENTRSVTLTADDAAEGLLRWLFRRTPRRELPPSPVVGKPQTMYAPTARIEDEVQDDE